MPKTIGVSRALIPCLVAAAVALPVSASVTMRNVTKQNSDQLPLIIEVHSGDRADGIVWFRIEVSPRVDDDSHCVGGSARIMEGNKVGVQWANRSARVF